MKDSIPNIDELVDTPLGLDEKSVIKHFLGLDRTEAKNMIKEQDPFPYGVYTEDLMWMAVDGFSYYLPSFVEAFEEIYKKYGEYYAEELCSGMLCSMSFHAEITPESILNNRDIILCFLKSIENKKMELLKDPWPYGNYIKIKKLIQQGERTELNTLNH